MQDNSVQRYYDRIESKLGYQLLLGNVKHFGYYKPGQKISLRQAMENMQEVVATELKLKPRQQIFDAGCGYGETANYISKNYRVHVTGLDLLKFNIVGAKQKFGSNKNLEFITGDYTNTTFKPSSFDGIYTIETVVHVPNHQTALAEFWRILKPGGRLVMLEYSHDKLDTFTNHERNRFDIINRYSHMPSFHEFEHGVLEESLKQQGFKILKIEDLSNNIRPMLRRFWQLAWIPYQFIRVFRLEKHFINTVSGYELYVHPKLFRYNMYVVKKPG